MSKYDYHKHDELLDDLSNELFLTFSKHEATGVEICPDTLYEDIEHAMLSYPQVKCMVGLQIVPFKMCLEMYDGAKYMFHLKVDSSVGCIAICADPVVMFSL